MKQQNQLIIQEKEYEEKIVQKISQHHQDYLNYFSDIADDLLSRNHLIEQLQSNGNIKYTECNEDQYFKISVLNYTSTYQIINLQVQYGPYKIPITIYNVLENSLAHFLQTISSSVANIYAYQQSTRQEAIKCFPLKKQSFEESFIGALKEYCIFKIAATLNVGPSLSKLCGFDLIVFSQCIEFCMEKGLSLKNLDKIQNSKVKFKKLKKKLRVLHSLNIVHMDIKPTNICLHQKEDHLLFIDFGFSNVILQQIGSKSLVCFFGSLNYCCPQMLNMYNTGQSQLVDLYYNDVYALKKVEKQIFTVEQEEQVGTLSKYELYQLNYEQKFTFKIEQKLQQFYKLARVKYLFFSASPQIVYRSFIFQLFCLLYKEFASQGKSKETMKIFLCSKKPLIKFTKTLPYSRLLEEFYDLLNEHNQDTYNEDVVKSTVQNYISLRQNDDGVKATSSQILQRYSATLNGIHIKRRDIMNVNLNYTKEMGLKEIVSNPHIAKEFKKSVYFEKYIVFVNFKVGLSCFEEKIDAAKVMCQVLGIAPTKSEFYDMEVSYLISSLRHLMQFYLVEEDKGFLKCLPIILGNLVILEELSETEVVLIITKLFNKKIPITEYTTIAIKLLLSLHWSVQQSSSRYKISSLTEACSRIIQNHFTEIKTQSESEKIHIQGIKLFLDLDYVAVTRRQVQVFQTFVDQKLPFEEEIKKQIMLFIKTITLKLYFHEENSQKIINCIKLISEQENIYNNPHFQYYHFKIFYFFFSTQNIRAMESIIKKLQICLGSSILTSKYYISDLYYSQIFIQRNMNNSSFYQQLIKFLQADPKDTKKRILAKVSHMSRLSKQDYNHINTQIKGFISTIYTLLRQTFPLDGLLDFEYLYNWYGGYVRNFGHWCYKYVNIMGSIYPPDKYTFSCLKHFEDKLKTLPTLMKCQFCRQRFESNLIIIETFRLQLEGQYQQIINIYKQYAFKETFHNQNQFKLLCVMDILRLTIKVPALNYMIGDCVELYCEWMTKKDAWFQSFNIIAKSTKAFEITNRYFFMKRHFVEYFKVQEKYVQSILQYPTKQYIISYCSSLIQFISKFTKSQVMIIQQFKLLKVLEKYKNPYFSLLASIVLIFCPLIDDPLANKITLYIYTNIPKIITFAKSITRGHLFYYLAKQSAFLLSNRQKKEQKQRKLLFKIKMYTKSSIHNLTFPEFKINYANGKKLKRNHQRIHNSYEIKLSRYFSIIKRSKGEKINSLNFPYPSPFSFKPH